MKCARTTEQGDKYGLNDPSYSSLAQSVERMTVNHDVAGSSPAGGARKKHLRKQVLFSTMCSASGT